MTHVAGRSPRLALSSLLLQFLLCAPLVAEDWHQFRGPDRDGKSVETGLLKSWPEAGPHLAWHVSGIGKGYSHVAVAEGLVFVTGLAGTQGVLHAFTPDGALQWRSEYGPEHSASYPGARTIPTVRDGLVYLASGMGNVVCLNAADGSPVWQKNVFELYEAPPLRWGYSESLLIDGENVIVTPCGAKSTMIALDRRTGQEIWASPPIGQTSSFCSPILFEHGGRRLIVTLTKTHVVAFSATDGAPVWQHAYQNFRGNHPVSPIYHDGMLYVTSGYGKGAVGLALSEDGGSVSQVWEQPRQDPVHGQAVLVDGFVYAASHQRASGHWLCVELKTGNLVWEDPGVGRSGSVIYADGMLYCYSEDGKVGLVPASPEGCRVVSRFDVPLGDGEHWAHPVVANGRLYIRHGDALMCYDLAAQ